MTPSERASAVVSEWQHATDTAFDASAAAALCERIAHALVMNDAALQGYVDVLEAERQRATDRHAAEVTRLTERCERAEQHARDAVATERHEWMATLAKQGGVAHDLRADLADARQELERLRAGLAAAPGIEREACAAVADASRDGWAAAMYSCHDSDERAFCRARMNAAGHIASVIRARSER